MTEFEFFTQASDDDFIVRGTHIAADAALDGRGGVAWWASDDGGRWVLVGVTSHDDPQRALGVTRLAAARVQECIERCGWAWGEVQTARGAMEQMGLSSYTRVELTREETIEPGASPQTRYTIEHVEEREV